MLDSRSQHAVTLDCNAHLTDKRSIHTPTGLYFCQMPKFKCVIGGTSHVISILLFLQLAIV